MKRTFLACAAAAILATASAPAQTADERFKAIYEAEWAWRDAQFAAGEDDAKPVADHLPKVDPATQEMRLAYWRDVLTALDRLSYPELTDKAKTDFDVYRPQIADFVADWQFRTYEMPVNSDSAFWTDLVYAARRPFRSRTDYRNWIAQMGDIPRYFAEQTDEMRAGLKRGFTPPAVTLRGRDAALETVIEAKPEDTVFYLPFKTMPGVPAGEAATLRTDALEVIREKVQPAYRKILAFWHDEYVPGARRTLAAEALPDGKAFYRQQIREFTTLDLPPAEIHAFGVAEVDRLHGEMLATMKESGFRGDFPAFLAFLRRDPQFVASSGQDLLNRAAWIAKEFDGVASQYFGLMPRGRFAIKPVPDDLAPFYTSGRGGPGLYEVNTYDLPHRPLYALPALTLHESAPGHAWQMALAAEDAHQPDFRRYGYISAYGEGWALYCEWLGQEMGIYRTPYERFGMLSYQIWRAARLVVDTGIHTQGWTRTQAIDYLKAYTALPEHEIETEVDRYIAWPGQALSYYLGEKTILDARHKAENALGPAFDIRAFHDTVLQLGSVPLPVLTAHIDSFIASGGKGPYPESER